MTDKSRVEAVARAIDQSGCWETYDDLMRAGGYFPSDGLLARLDKSKQRAQAAIEANDAWLKVQVAPQKPCPSCEEPCSIEEMECPKCGVALW